MDELLIEEDGEVRRERMTLAELAAATGLSHVALRRFVVLGLIDPREGSDEPTFEPAVLPRVQRMLRLRRDLQLGWSSLGLVLDLLDRVERLERELARRG